jgi:hypothetical protein
MSETIEHSGGCLCGAVEYEVQLQEPKAHICHCHLCQKWGGSSSITLHTTPDWTIRGENKLKWYDSSEWAQRSFCSECGTHLLFRLKDGSYHGVTAGSLKDQSGLEIGMHIFIDKKPNYYDFKDDAPRLTEQEFQDMIANAAEA